MDKTTSRKEDYPEAEALNTETSTAANGTSTIGAATTQPRQFFRASSRVFCLNGEWYFQTREDDHGPFTRREAAELALERYVDEMQDLGGISREYPSFDAEDMPEHSTTQLSLL